MTPPTPPWIEVRPGTAPVVLFAPHGGRRLAARQPGRHKVNDLHTAAITAALAERLDASAVINRTRDRNEIDLNRIGQVRKRAPWLPALLAELLEGIVARRGHATLLVIHGWNVGQPACDVGIGMVERAGRLEAVRPGSPTVTAAFLDRLLPRLRATAQTHGIAVTVGARYAAAHPNNLLQLCTAAGGDPHEPSERRLGALAAAGVLDAAQLELGLPLRWPGPEREWLLAHVTAALLDAPPAAPPETAAAVPARLACGGRVTARRTLQFVDDPLLGLSGMEVGAKGGVGGRLLLSATPDALELFTGELGDRTGPRWHVPPLRYTDAAAGWDLEFRGRLLSFPTLEPFLDLEHGLAGGRLCAADVTLRFRRLDAGRDAVPAPPGFGRLTGVVVLDDRRFAVDTIALESDGTTPPTHGVPSLRLVLPSTPSGRVVVGSSRGQTNGQGTVFELQGHAYDPARRSPVSGAATLTLDARASGTLVGQLGDAAIHGTLERLIPIRRPGRPGTVLHTTYGLVRLAGRPPGWIELTTEHALARGDPVTDPGA